MSQQTIETYAKEKGIPYLLHFTRAVNPGQDHERFLTK